MAPTRWQALFADLEGQAVLLEEAEVRAEVADRTRLERGRLGLWERLAPLTGQHLGVQVNGTRSISGELVDLGPDWLLLTQAGGQEALVALSAVLSVTGVGPWAAVPQASTAVAKRLDLRWALRGLARSRAGVAVTLLDATTYTGTIDRVGADHLDLAEHAPGEARRSAQVTSVRMVTLSAVAVVRSG